jgi:peptide subunit release factor 1 (eRF1)
MRHELQQVVQASGPFASVYLDASHGTADATHQNELRWHAARSELASRGADESTIDAVGAVLLDEHPVVGDAGRAVVAAHGTVLVDEVLPLPPRADVVRYSDLPYLVPLLAMAAPDVPYVVAVADKVGARLHAVDRSGVEVADQTVRGEDHPVHQVGGGGQAHRSIENRAEEIVRRNARDVAEQVTKLVERVGARLVVLAGEVQGRSAVRTALPGHVERLVTELDLDAAAIDERPEQLARGVARLLAEDRAADEVAAVDRLHTGAAHGTAREGLGPVLAALRAGQVETLLVTDPALGDREVLVGPDRSQVALSADELPEAGGRLVTERADEALPAAAIATSADVLVLAGQTEVTDGVAALLRYA